MFTYRFPSVLGLFHTGIALVGLVSTQKTDRERFLMDGEQFAHFVFDEASSTTRLQSRIYHGIRSTSGRSRTQQKGTAH